MIIGLTHDEELKPRQRLAIGWKVAIGLPASGARNHPEKLDHFHIVAKSGRGEWTEDEGLARTLTEKYDTRPDTNSGQPKLREFDVIFLSDDIDEVFQTELAWWSASEKKCSGDGRAARRSLGALSEAARRKHDPGERFVPWSPCGDECEDRIAGRCKPNGMLYFVFADKPVIGSVAFYATTSRRSILQIQSSLLQIRDITGGKLRGIPLKMVLRPGKVRFQGPGGSMTNSVAFFVNIEFRKDDYDSTIRGLLTESGRHDKAILEVGAGDKQPSSAHDVMEVERLPEDEQASVMAPEFYPGNTGGADEETETGPPAPSKLDTARQALEKDEPRRPTGPRPVTADDPITDDDLPNNIGGGAQTERPDRVELLEAVTDLGLQVFRRNRTAFVEYLGNEYGVELISELSNEQLPKVKADLEKQAGGTTSDREETAGPDAQATDEDWARIKKAADRKHVSLNGKISPFIKNTFGCRLMKHLKRSQVRQVIEFIEHQ